MEQKQNWLRRLLNKNRITDEDYAQMEDENSPPPKLNVIFADSRRIIMSGLLIILVFFGIGGAWITLAEISGAVISSGEVRVDTERKTVQHLEGGIIKEIKVRNGDKVEKGQTLIVLDSSRIISETEQVRLRLAAARLADIRLQAERGMTAQVPWPKSEPGIPEAKYRELLESAQKVFASRRQALTEQISMLKKQIAQLTEQDSSLQGRVRAEKKIIAALQEELEAKQVLYERQYIDKTRILELERNIAEHEGIQAQLHGSRAELRERIAELELRMSALQSEYRQKATEEHNQNQQRIYDLQQQLLPLIDASNRLNITAPVSGEIIAMQVHSVGGVIRSGEPILDIVPEGSPLIVECNIQVKDITHVHKGQEADVQLLAFEQRTTPKIHGKVVYISADRILRKTAYGEQPTYIVHVELDKVELHENDLYISAGMPAAVFIKTEPRTVLDYLIEPLKENFDRALRET
nr:HlyD family type I secretion periplasmic adaptor subunit [uncultured Desulfuromonas sp.]